MLEKDQSCVDSTEVVCPSNHSEDGGSTPTSTLQNKSHQRLIREKLAESEHTFIADIETAVVKEISRVEAKSVILKYEWLGSMPGFIVKCFGIFFLQSDEQYKLGGVVVYSCEYTENLGVWDKFGFTGKIICLSRGACVHWAHPHSASKLICTSMKMLPERYKVITCTVDAQAGEIGTIYQACNFDYIGVMSPKGAPRASIILPDGKTISERHAFALYGTRSVKKLREMGFTVNATPRKGRYFTFIGNKKEKRDHRKAIEHLIKPYPKRVASNIVQLAEEL